MAGSANLEAYPEKTLAMIKTSELIDTLIDLEKEPMQHGPGNVAADRFRNILTVLTAF